MGRRLLLCMPKIATVGMMRVSNPLLRLIDDIREEDGSNDETLIEGRRKSAREGPSPDGSNSNRLPNRGGDFRSDFPFELPEPELPPNDAPSLIWMMQAIKIL